MKSIAVIVTYNRCELLKENLLMLEKQTKQLDKVLIIDNHSNDGTQKNIEGLFKNSILNIDYRYMEDNYGGAGGFYYGVRYALEDNADFIWLMDDDGRPFDEYTFENIYNEAIYLYKTNKMLFLNSLVTYNGIDLSFGFTNRISLSQQLKIIEKEKKGNILYNKVNPFNGTLITKELVEKIGFPRKEFFISRDETDYMNRSKMGGATIATIVNSIYYHPKSKLTFKKIFGFSTQIYNDLDKEYYFIRNMVFSYKDNNKKKIWGFIIMRLITIVIYEDKKFKRIVQLFRAKSDGYKNKMGKKEIK